MRILLLLLLVATPAIAQMPDTLSLSRTRADALTGLYLLSDGRVIHVTDLRDQVGGAPLTLWVVPNASHGLMLGPGNSLGYPPGLHDRLVAWIAGAAGVRSGS